ncbi:hypothetical protein BHM03_00038535, partial [Ensete ventricosum]
IPIIKEKPSFLDLPHRLWFLLPARDFKFPCCDLPLPVDRICIWIAAASLAATVGLEAVAIAEEKGRRPSGRRLAPCHDMAASGGSQHRCVFGRVFHFQFLGFLAVGNIPYDATEEQLIQICEEVGPVVSFRSASFKTLTINLDVLEADLFLLGRGGPGLASSADVQKQFSGAPISGDSTLHQPLGLPLAATAASVMTGVLGGAQTSNAQNAQIMLGMVTPQMTGLSNVQPPSVGLETLPRQISTSSADSVRTSRIRTQSLSGGPADRTSMTAHILEPISYPPSKLRRLEDGSGATQTLITNPAVNNAALRTLGSGTVAGSRTIVTDSVGHSEKKMPQVYIHLTHLVSI